MADELDRLKTTWPQVFATANEAETEALGSRLSALFRAGDVIALHGDLGAGKTCLVRGMVAGLGGRDTVNSPTFTLINQYQGRLPIYHVDLYRLEGLLEMEDLDLEDYFFGSGICMVEWAQKISRLLPPSYWSISLNIKSSTDRSITVDKISQ